jgi:predicted GIY-YIG superfamily endonuclease
VGKKPNGYWTKERCHEESLKFNSRVDLKTKCGSVYATAVREGWLIEICNHMKHKLKSWDYDKCKKEALKYNNRTEFQYGEGSRGAYNHAKENGFLDKICEHMEMKGNLFKRCIYAFEFEDNHVYIGLTYNIKERKIDHLNKKKSQVYRHKNKTNSKYILKQLTEYIDIKNACQKEEYYVNKYKKQGWIILNKSKTGSIGGKPIIWSNDLVRKEALKYNNKTEFIKKSKGAYSYALKNNIVNNICNHMISLDTHLTKPKQWTPDEESFLIINIDKGIDYCCKKLDRSEQSVLGKWYKLKKL